MDADTFALCQPGRRVERVGVTSVVRPLGGLVRCAECGYAMACTHGKRAVAYACRGRHHGGRCAAPGAVTAAKLDALVAHQVDLAIADPAHPGYEHVQAAMAGGDEFQAAKDALDAAVSDLRAWVRQGSIGLAPAMVQEGIAARQERIDRARRRLAQAPVNRPWWEGVERVMSAAEFDARDTKALYRRLIERVEVAKAPDRTGRDLESRVRIVWRGSAADTAA